MSHEGNRPLGIAGMLRLKQARDKDKIDKVDGIKFTPYQATVVATVYDALDADNQTRLRGVSANKVWPLAWTVYQRSMRGSRV